MTTIHQSNIATDSTIILVAKKLIKSGTELRYNYSDTKNLHWRAKVCFSLYLFNRFCWKVILMSHDLVELPHYSYCCYIFRYGWRNFRKKPFAPSQLTMWRMHSMARLGLAVYGDAKHWYRYNSSLLVTETFTNSSCRFRVPQCSKQYENFRLKKSNKLYFVLFLL